jgi:hypothetical protein
MNPITRRSCIARFCFGLGGSIFGRAASLPHTSSLTWDVAMAATATPETLARRTYRADAQILVLGVPLLHRPGVGGGSAIWRESVSPRGGLLRFLEFTGFSLPERAAGLNRFGFIREISRLEPGGPVESIYFGLMTSSPEESADEARKALNPAGKEVAYSVIEGSVASNQANTAVAHFSAPAEWSVRNREELMKQAERALAEVPQSPAHTGLQPSGLPTFLGALADLLRDHGRDETRYVYNGKLYHLRLTCSEDAKASKIFRDRSLITDGAEVVRATGELRQATGGKEHWFRVWFDASARMPIPLRIEYQAKSFLRLVFEAESPA